MKTQILKLESYDDVLSVRDKMNWGKTGRIILVWPEKERILTRQVDLTLLQRHSQSLGAQLALVTRDPLVCFHARELAIPVFGSLSQANRSAWRVSRRAKESTLHPLRTAGVKLPNLRQVSTTIHPISPAWLTHPVTRLVLFTLGVTAILTIAALLLPGAEVHLQPEIITQETSLGVQASRQFVSIQLTGALPVRTISIIVEGSHQVSATGKIEIADQAATGSLLITNLTQQAVTIPQGTTVRNVGVESVRFEVTQSGKIPPGIGQAISLPIRALDPGGAGNLPENSLTAIEGDLGLSVTVNNPQPTQGGSNRTAAAPTTQDRERLSKQLEASLLETVLKKASSNLQPGDLLLSTNPLVSQTLSRNYNPPEDQPADFLDLSLRQEFQFPVASRQDLENLATAVLDTSLPQGYAPIPGSLALFHLTDPTLEEGDHYEWRMQAQRQLQAQIDSNQAINLSMSLKPAVAIQRLFQSLPLRETPTILLTPTWWPRLPILPFRIHVRVEI